MPNKTIDPQSELAKLFELHFGNKAENIEALPQSGSNRKYFRLKNKSNTAIGTYNSDVSENNTYFYFTQIFKKHNILVPEIFAISQNNKFYLQEDVGNTSLLELLLNEGKTEQLKNFYKKSLDQLAAIHWIASQEINYEHCFATAHFDLKAIMNDLLYFKYYFADLQKINYNQKQFSAEIELFSKELAGFEPQTFMYRDFQSRNIMIHQDNVYFIDYQGGMKGAPQYDLASILGQAKAQLPEEWKEELYTHYISQLTNIIGVKLDAIYFKKGYLKFELLRLLQVLGAYGFRGLFERKPHFLSSISPALQNLQNFLVKYPQIPEQTEFRTLLEKIATIELIEKYKIPQLPSDIKLKISICSFSYKNGYPKDDTGNGGGFVFDCRGILNPGRFDDYKFNSGLDQNVQAFLLNQTKMPEFLENIWNTISISIDDYIARGFENLSLSFGCTGGQHRSVFAAETITNRIQNHYQLKSELNHNNRNNWLKK